MDTCVNVVIWKYYHTSGYIVASYIGLLSGGLCSCLKMCPLFPITHYTSSIHPHPPTNPLYVERFYFIPWAHHYHENTFMMQEEFIIIFLGFKIHSDHISCWPRFFGIWIDWAVRKP